MNASTAPASIRFAARALARRVSDAGRPERATTLRSASMCWTLARAAREARGWLDANTDNATLRADLAAFAETCSRATGASETRNVLVTEVSL